MTPDQNAALAVAVVGGLGVIGSYIYLSTAHKTSSYVNSPLWLELGRSVTIPLTVLQMLAAVGFIAAIGSWIFGAPPDGGIMSLTAMLPVTLGFFLAASIAWAILVAQKNPPKAAVSVSLVVAAVTSILLLAGAAEEAKPRWWIVLGLILFCAVTVLADGVVWNARYLKRGIRYPNDEEPASISTDK